MTVAGNVHAERRLDWIRARLDASGLVRIRDAATELDVSEMTIRRDLLELEAHGQARRVRGGAIAVGPVQFADRHRQGARAKARIAAKLCPLVPEAGAIALDASSTMLRLATLLEGARDLTVITNGPETFAALQGKSGIHPVLTGGSLEPRTGSLVGPIASRAAASFLFSNAFVSAAAVDAELGASEAALDEAEVKRALARVAVRVVLAADSSKLDRRALAMGLTWADVDLFVTDLDPGAPALASYRNVSKVV